MQNGWLGDLNGVAVEFDLQFEREEEFPGQGERLPVHTVDPSLAVSGATSFIAIGPQHLFWNDRFRRVSPFCHFHKSNCMAVLFI